MTVPRDNISVVVRVRPPKHENDVAEWILEEGLIYAGRPEHVQKVFAFDNCFSREKSNADVFERAVYPIVSSVVAGFNGTILAYGGTSSGKTHTMMGHDHDPGMIRRTIDKIFDEIHEASHREFLIRVSYREIFEQQTRDLLPDSDPISHSFERTATTVAGVTEKITTNREEMLRYLTEGDRNRQVGSPMDGKSSRSHSIFRITIESSGRNSSVRVSTLSLVDLANSEGNTERTSTTSRLRDHPVTELESVVQELASGGEDFDGHDLFLQSDSELTKILKDSLGGNCLTVFICNISATEYESSLSTLRFASKAEQIRNKPVINLVRNQDSSLLLKLNEEIKSLNDLISRVESSEEQPLQKKEETIDRLRRKIENLKKLSASGHRNALSVSAGRNGIHHNGTSSFGQSPVSVPYSRSVNKNSIEMRCGIRGDDAALLTFDGPRKRKSEDAFQMLETKRDHISIDDAPFLEDELEEIRRERASATKRSRPDPQVAIALGPSLSSMREEPIDPVRKIDAVVQTEAESEKIDSGSQVFLTNSCRATQTIVEMSDLLPDNRQEAATQTEGVSDETEFEKERAARLRAESELIEVLRDRSELSEINDKYIEYFRAQGLNSKELLEGQAASGENIFSKRRRTEVQTSQNQDESWLTSATQFRESSPIVPAVVATDDVAGAHSDDPLKTPRLRSPSPAGPENETPRKASLQSRRKLRCSVIEEAESPNLLSEVPESEKPVVGTIDESRRDVESSEKSFIDGDSLQSESDQSRHQDLRTGRKYHVRHQRRNLPAKSGDSGGHQRTRRKKKLFACDFCEKRFTRLGHFKDHRRTHTGEKPFACDICEKRFTQLVHLKVHRRTHTGEKPFACDICEKRFAASSNLVHHRRSHTGEKPFACDICEKRFAVSPTLVDHRRTHTGEKPFACDVCEKRFAVSSNLNYHRKKHHRGKPLICHQCGQSFIQKRNFKVHRESHIGSETPRI